MTSCPISPVALAVCSAEQIRLARDRVDQFGYVADPGRRTGELTHALGRRPCLAS